MLFFRSLHKKKKIRVNILLHILAAKEYLKEIMYIWSNTFIGTSNNRNTHARKHIFTHIYDYKELKVKKFLKNLTGKNKRMQTD